MRPAHLALGLGVGAAMAIVLSSKRAGATLPPPSSFAPTGGSGKAWVGSLGEQPSDERELAILDAVARRFFVPITWVEIPFTKGEHSASIFVATDSLRVGSSPDDAVRVSVRHSTAQRIADRLGAVLPTTLMSDVAWLAAETTLPPKPQPADAKMGRTSRMLDYSDIVGRAIAEAGGREGQLVRTTGKDWVTTERLLARDGSVATPTHSTIGRGGGAVPAAANFGWHMRGARSRSPGGQPVVQSVGLAHDIGHVDYSQTVQLVRADCLVDGVKRAVVDVLRDPELAHMLSDEVGLGQACRVTRHPAVPP